MLTFLEIAGAKWLAKYLTPRHALGVVCDAHVGVKVASQEICAGEGKKEVKIRALLHVWHR